VKRTILGYKSSSDSESQYEQEITAEPGYTNLSIQIETASDLSDAIDKVWVLNKP